MHAPISKIDNAMLKYGEDDFELKIIKCCKPKYLNRFEKLFIKIYNAYENDFHYNLTVGGDGLGSGEDHPNFGKKHTEEHKRKISASIMVLKILNMVKYEAKNILLRLVGL